MPQSQVLGFVLTLFATLAGVVIAFQLERRAESNSRKETVTQHLEAVKRELNRNSEVIWQNHRVIGYLQKTDSDALHYSLEPLSHSAWDAAVQDQIIDSIEGSLYQDLQKLYSRTENVNELIKRLRTESLHPELNGSGNDSSGGNSSSSVDIWDDAWTMSMVHWDKSEDEVRENGLGDLIKNRSNEVNIQIDGVSDKIQSEKERLGKETNLRYPQYHNYQFRF